MKILAFSDMHGSKLALNKIKKQAKDADVLVCAGDLTIFERDLKTLLSKFDKLKKPVIIIAGNHESDESLRKESKKLDNIVHVEDSTHSIGNYHFLCSSGDGFAYNDPQFEKTAKRFLRKIKSVRKDDRDAKFILVTHAPPHNTKTDMIIGGHCGNKSLRRFIIKARPALNICGHIHENKGKKDIIGKTKIINPGPFGKIIRV